MRPTDAQVDRLREEIKGYTGQLEEKRLRLDEINELFGKKVYEHQVMISNYEKEIAELEARLSDELRASGAVEDPLSQAPGPACLRWVMHPPFQMVVSLVIMLNMYIFFNQLSKPGQHANMTLDLFFLGFYIVELSLKLALLQCTMLFGDLSEVWPNWLDLTIVITGVIDVYMTMQSEGQHNQVLNHVLRCFRVLRLLRLLKVVRQFCAQDLSWVDGETFQAFIMANVGLNCLLMFFEADYPDMFSWQVVEDYLLAVFFFELATRIKTHGRSFFCGGSGTIWNWLDFVIVAGGIIDSLMLPAISLVLSTLGMKPLPAKRMKAVMNVLRMARLLRLLRLMKLIKRIPPLYSLITGIIQALQGMVWVMILTCVVIYVFALLVVKLVASGLVLSSKEATDVAAETFSSVRQSMYIFFNAMNGDCDDLGDVFEAVPFVKLFTLIFMVISSWAILSILTAVVSENLMAANDKLAEESEQATRVIEEDKKNATLNRIFSTVDADESGDLTSAEFDVILGSPDMCDSLMSITNMSKDDMLNIFDYLSAMPEDGSEPTIKHSTFIHGLDSEGRPVNARSSYRLGHRISMLEREVSHLSAELDDAPDS